MMPNLALVSLPTGICLASRHDAHSCPALTPNRDLLSQRTDRLVTTLHMLEMRNMRLSAESAALQDGVAAMSAAHDTLLQERDSLSAMLYELNRKVCARRPVIMMRSCLLSP